MPWGCPGLKMMLKEFKMDLHIHTCLSPCAQSEMLPTAIIKKAKEQNLDAVGICDHNSAENITAVRKAAQSQGLHVLAGMEICSREEVHILVFFEDDNALMRMQTTVYKNLPGVNNEKYFGEQFIADEYDKVVGSTKKLLIGSTTLGVNEIVASVHSLGGLTVASHVDRESFGIIGQLGFIPKELPLDALEISPRCNTDEIENYRSYGFPLITSSDAHFLSDIGRVFTKFLLSALSFSEVAMAFRGIQGRAVSI